MPHGLLRLLRCAPRPSGAVLRSWQRRRSAGSTSQRALQGEAESVEVPHLNGIPVPPVEVAYTPEEIDRCVERSFATRPLLLGFDTEFRPTFEKDVPLRRTALMQLASADACLLAHVYPLEQLPPRLSALVEDPTVYKVGTGVVGDLDKLAEDFPEVRPASFVDLGVIARLFRYERIGMKAMSEHFGAQVVKSKDTQLSDWEVVPLSVDQVAYGAEDAALGLWLLDRLHGAHGGGMPLHAWADLFLDARSAHHLATRLATQSGPLRDVAAAFVAAAAEEEAARYAEKLDKRAMVALQAGLADPRHAISSLFNLAKARGTSVQWSSAVRSNKAGTALVEASCRVGGVRLAQGKGSTRSLARRRAAVAALRLLAAEAGVAASGEPVVEELVPKD